MFRPGQPNRDSAAQHQKELGKLVTVLSKMPVGAAMYPGDVQQTYAIAGMVNRMQNIGISVHLFLQKRWI